MEGAGKTTFLYKLKCEGWKPDQIIKEMKYLKDTGKDPVYHYEEFAGPKHYKYGIWDIPGQSVDLGLTNMFYKYIRIAAVLFMVDTRKEFAEDHEKVERTKATLDFLLNEDELRNSVFVLIYNVRSTDTSSSSKKDAKGASNAKKDAKKATTDEAQTTPAELMGESIYEQAVKDMLQVEWIKEQPQHKHRFLECRLNASDINVAAWNNIVLQMRSIQKEIAPGAADDE
jgi:GTPase SAR1 family protein